MILNMRAPTNPTHHQDIIERVSRDVTLSIYFIFVDVDCILLMRM